MFCFQGLGDPSNPNYDSWYNFEYKVLGGVITGVILPIFNVLYQMLARVLTKWENHRREVKHTDGESIFLYFVRATRLTTRVFCLQRWWLNFSSSSPSTRTSLCSTSRS